MFALAKRGVELCRKIALLGISLLFQFGNRRIHLVDLLIQHRKGVLGFAQFTRSGRDGFFLLL
ncbi:hypothetical protein D3C85_1383650 [compost metagenome]